MENNPITYAYLETTNYCNLNCSFCNRVDVIDKLQHMPIEKWEILLDKIKHHPITEAKLMGMGEPFLHPDFSTILKMFKDVFPECKVITATNCQYDFVKVKDCLPYIDLLYLSIDGYLKSYERDRAPATWDKLLKFLDDFKLHGIDENKVVINYVVNTNNVFDIPKIEVWMENYGLEILRLNITQNWSEDEGIDNGFTPGQLTLLNSYKNRIMGKSEWEYKDCFWVKNAIYITVDGYVKMCCLNTGAKPFGNIFEISIDDIRLTDDYQQVKMGCATNIPTEHCQNCSYKELAPILSGLGVNNG